MNVNFSKYLSAVVVIILLMTAATCGDMHAILKESTFTSSSRLASGKWVRVEATATGMHYISDANLKQMGFASPEKVKVYGFGGRMLSEELSDGMPDDLPNAASMRVPGGLVFFATDAVRWSIGTRMTHTMNPYSDHSYYFLSDSENSWTLPVNDSPEKGDAPICDTFTECLLHEQELSMPGHNGRDVFGEELRNGQSRNISFNTPDRVSDKTKIAINYGANVKGGSSSIIVTANGEQLPSSNNDKLEGVTSSSGFLVAKTSLKDFQTDSEKLDLNIKYSATGTFYGAWLDYVEVTYSRKLKLRDGELFFRIQATLPTNIKVSGCSGSTRIWDVTDPMNPKEVKYTLTGSDAVFSCEGKLLEFIAFEPEKIKRQTINSIPIDNQDIHGMEVPDYLIITPPEYLAAANKIADLRRETDGMTVHVLTPDKLYNEFSSGMQDPTAFRKAMKMWHDRGARAGGKKLKYCLLLSRPTYDSKAVTPSVKNNPYPRLPQWQSTGIYIDDTAYGTDDYIGMMTDTSPFRMSRSKVDIAVGRFAVTSEQEANIMADKLVKYVKDPELGSWRNNVLMIADDGDSQTHMAQSDTALENMRNNGNGNNFVYERLYTDAYERKATGSGLAFPGAKERFINRLNEGVSFVNYVGHANPRGWTHENLFIWNDIIGMTNKRLPFLAAYCCEFLRWDADDVSGGEKMWLHPTSGVIGMLCASRSVFMGPNGRLNAAFGKNLFKRDATTGESLRIGDVMVAAKNEADTYDDNKFRFALLGDPAMKVPNPTYQTTIESIGDTPVVTTPSDYPQLGAGSKSLIKGSILRKDGTIADDFNGIVEVTLYDAEIPVTTNGYECNEYSYNERTTRLNSLRVKAVEGKWQTTLTVPMEINNNYSPARIVAYAYSDDGREANGSCENLYVYGYDPSDNADDAGPEIKRFVLNNDNFADGGAVSTSPVVLATVADPSGINVSDAGIGHKLSLILDGKTHYEDVNQYYMADHENEGQGMITYPLSDLEAGHHTLELCVWDNANNSSRATINFQVAVGVAPTIYDVCTDCNPARTSVVFTVSTDRAMSRLGCTLDVFDLNGAKVWTSTSDGATDNESNISFGWDLKDKSGRRVPRGIYLYRATVESPDGMTQTKTKKLAVTAE